MDYTVKGRNNSNFNASFQTKVIEVKPAIVAVNVVRENSKHQPGALMTDHDLTDVRLELLPVHAKPAKVTEIKLDYVSQRKRAKPKSKEQELADRRSAAQREKQRQFLVQRRLSYFTAAPRHDALNVHQVGPLQRQLARPNTSVPTPPAETTIEPRPTSQKGMSAK